MGPKVKKFIRSRDVIFREDQTPSDFDEQLGGAVKGVDLLVSDDEQQQGDTNEVVSDIPEADDDELPPEPETLD